MELDLTQHFLTKNDCYREGSPLMPKGIMVHSTGVAQPNPQVFLRSWNRPGVSKCVHAFVSKDGAVQTLPWTVRGWHAGSGSGHRSANDTHLSFECCEPAGHTYQGGQMAGYDVQANQDYFDHLYYNAVALTALLCRQFLLDPLQPGVVICHAEGHNLGIASGHGDVLHWWPKHGITMDRFRRDVADTMLMESGPEGGMTQASFDQMMERYLARRAQLPPAPWSEQARQWAQQAGIISGSGDGPRYLSFATREEVVQMLYRLDQKLTP